MKWLPDPTVPSWAEPRCRARSRDGVRVRRPRAARRLGALDVVLACRSPRSSRARGPSRRTASSSAPSQRQRRPRGRRRPAPARDLVDERLLAGASSSAVNGPDQQAHAAVDVVADPARRDDAVGGLGRRKPADREAVALVDVRHRHRRLDDAGQRGDVLELLQRAVVADRVEDLAIGEHARAGTRMSAALGAGISHRVSSSCRAPSSPLRRGNQTSSTTVARQTRRAPSCPGDGR